MKKIIILLLFALSGGNLISQSSLFEQVDSKDVKMDNQQKELYDRFNNNPFVIDLSFVMIDENQLQEDKSLLINHQNFSTTATFFSRKDRGTNFGWFGTLDDGTGIFFTVFREKVFSKFYLGNTPYTIIPFSEGLHLLIGFDQEIAQIQCTTGEDHRKGFSLDPEPHKHKKNTTPLENNSNFIDDDCNLRVLIVFTDDADNVLDMQVIGQGLIDETNLAYMQSQINFNIELARTIRVNYNQDNGTSQQTIYGRASNTRLDLLRIRNGTNGFEDIPQLRDDYQADIVVLVREGDWGGSGLSGQAFGIPVGNFDPLPENAFAAVSNNNFSTLIAGRFTFAHEIGHVQGARHESDNANPNFARGFLVSNANNAIRSIVAAQGDAGGCNNGGTACRIQFFSNPNILFNGAAFGDATHNNARRINETSIDMRNHRMTAENLTLTEVFENEIIANHLANQTITTANVVDVQAGSEVTMRAGVSISLTPGFEAQTGSAFCARIDNMPCTTDPNNLVDQNSNARSIDSSKKGRLEEPKATTLEINTEPNPFTESTTFNIRLDGTTSVSLDILNTAGQLIQALLQDTELTKGNHRFEFQAQGLPPGIYLYRLSTDTETITKKMILSQ